MYLGILKLTKYSKYKNNVAYFLIDYFFEADVSGVSLKISSKK